MRSFGAVAAGKATALHRGASFAPAPAGGGLLRALRHEVENVPVPYCRAGGVDDLLRVAAEVGDGVEDRRRDVRLKSLDPPGLDEMLRGQPGQCRVGVADGGAQR